MNIVNPDPRDLYGEAMKRRTKYQRKMRTQDRLLGAAVAFLISGAIAALTHLYGHPEPIYRAIGALGNFLFNH